MMLYLDNIIYIYIHEKNAVAMSGHWTYFVHVGNSRRIPSVPCLTAICATHDSNYCLLLALLLWQACFGGGAA
jgi:hypothetical protein